MTRLPSLGWSVGDIPDLSGRVAVITGANSGLGLATARALAEAGAAIVMAVRTPSKGRSAAETIRRRHPSADVEVVELDLSDLGSVRRAAGAVSGRLDRLDWLIDNAGIMATPPQLSVDGVEMQFASNHLGHFALTGLLLPLLLATPSSRVVSVSSLAANSGSLVDHDPTSLDGYDRFKVYGTTKLANQAFTIELDRRLARSGGTERTIAVAAHPGLSSTNLQSGFQLGGLRQTVVDFGARFVTQPASIGALPTLRAAVDPDVRGGDYFGPGLPGQYYGLPKKIRMSTAATDPDVGCRLWEQSVALSGVDYAELG